MKKKENAWLADLGKGLVALRVTSPSGADAPIAAAMHLSKGKGFVLVLRDSVEIERRLLPAYVSAAMRFGEGSMHSKSLALEIMLFLAGTTNIGGAVARVRASGDRFIVFASYSKLCGALISQCRLRVMGKCNLELDPYVSSAVALTAINEDK